MNKNLIKLLKYHKAVCFNCGEYKSEFSQLNSNTKFYKSVLTDESILVDFDTIVGKVSDIRFLHELFWKYSNFQNLIVLGVSNPSEIIEPKSKYQNTKLWDIIAYHAKDDISCGGWYNSYNHNKFSIDEMNDYVNNIENKLSPYLNKNSIVLEIGCSSGLTMFRLASKVKKYIGTDFSQQMINRNSDKIHKEKIHNIDLFCVSAEDIDSLGLNNIDVVIINSVIQLFDGYYYFYRVLKRINKLLNNQSVIFIGDIMDLKKKDDLILSTMSYKNINNSSNTKLDFSNDLFFSEEFFRDLEYDYPYEVLDISNKQHTIKNELTDYRYDVILKFDENISKENKKRIKNQFFYVV